LFFYFVGLFSVSFLSKSEMHSKIRNIDVDYDEVVVGSSLEALAYSFLNNIPFVCARFDSPYFFERFEPGVDLSVFDFKNDIVNLKTNKSPLQMGASKLRLWEKLYFYLNLSGLCIKSTNVSSLRIQGDVLKITTSNARLIKVHYNKLNVFDDHNVQGLSIPTTRDEKYVVYDWFQVKSGMKHEYDLIYDEGDFVHKLIFYPSERVAGEHNFKDVIGVSCLDKKQIEEFEYSDVNARFKTLYMMKEAGIKGARNGKDMKDRTKYKYYSVKVETSSREIVHPQNLYEPSDYVVFNSTSLCDIIENTKVKDCYASHLLRRTA